MKPMFAPGCGLMLYKPHLARRLHSLLSGRFASLDMSLSCCRRVPPLTPGTRVINVCPGCDRRYRENDCGSGTVSLWEVLVETPDLVVLPDYQGRQMTIIDACPTRSETRVHEAVRELARRMKITLNEPRNNRMRSTCCGDSCYGLVPKDRVLEAMRTKASQLPSGEVLVHCVSCAKAMFNGGRRPRYLIDLLFEEETAPQTVDPDDWHRELDEFIDSHP